MGSHSLIGLLAEPARLRLVAALVLGADTVAAAAERAGLGMRETATTLRRLEAAGLVSVRDGKLALHAELFQREARDRAGREEPEDYGAVDPDMLPVLRAFVRRGRLVEIPAAAGKRAVVLEYLAALFEPGESYEEREVNAILGAWHPDHAALRRYLVDAGLMSREAGVYRRSGGRLHLPPPRVRREQRLGAYGLAEDGAGRVLLTRLTRSGDWTLPGGRVEFGERPVEALVRELREETGLTVRVDALLDVDSELVRFRRDGERVEWHPLRVLYRITPTGGVLGVTEVGGSTAEAAWVHRADTGAMPLTAFARAVLETGRLGR